MRNLYPTVPDASLTTHQAPIQPLPARPSGTSPSLTDSASALHNDEEKRTFSQLNRRDAMRENARKALDFISEQERVIQQMTKQLMLYVGYREQIKSSDGSTENKHAWSVYLMHVQAIQHGMQLSYCGKPLFGYGTAPAVRIHLEIEGSVQPFDLPDPHLLSLPSLRSFLSGISDHRLPSVELGNACIAELLNVLKDVHIGRSRLLELSKQRRGRLQSVVASGSAIIAPSSTGTFRFNMGRRIRRGLDCFLGLLRPATTA